jgi:hypothetical protein
LNVSGHAPLTFVNWVGASLIGFGIFVAASFAAGVLGLGRYITAIALIGWIAGALAACYVRDLRYVKACLAVIGGVFLCILGLDAVVLLLRRY